MTSTEVPPQGADPNGEVVVSGSASVASLLADAAGRMPATPVPTPSDEWGRTPSIWPRLIGGLGRTLIATGTLILLFVVYQLWGTGIREARAQSALRGEFAQLIDSTASGSDAIVDLDQLDLPESLPADAQVGTADADVSGTDTAGAADGIDVDSLVWTPNPDLYGPPPPPPDDGDAVARIRIPKIGVDKVVVEGVSIGALKKGPGHYPDTPLPGQPGNAAIAGHRTTYGAPFFHFDRLEPDDLIYVTTPQGSFQYRVIDTEVVSPGALDVLDPTDDNRLTLTTCHPRWSASQRLIVVAELIGDAADAQPVAAPTDAAPDDALAGEDAAGSAVDQPAPGPETATTAGADVDATTPYGLGGERAAALPAILWGLVCAALWIGFWLLGRAWRRVPAYLIGLPIFLVALFFFFDDFSRLLPANI